MYRIVDGDWFVRTEASVERRMAALQSIFRSYTGKEILLEKRMVEREVLVASGQWAFHQIEEKDVKLRQGKAVLRKGSVALYVDNEDLWDENGGGSGALVDLFQRLQQMTRLRIIDEVAGQRPKRVQFSDYLMQ